MNDQMDQARREREARKYADRVARILELRTRVNAAAWTLVDSARVAGMDELW